MIAGASAVLLFIFMLLDWYKVEAKAFGATFSQGGNAWDALGPGDIFLLLVILVTIGAVVVRALGAEANVPVPLSTVVLGAGALASLYILFRIIVDPVDVPSALNDAVSVKRGIGIFLGFLAALGITAGGFLSARERGEAIPGVGGAGLGGAGTAGGPLDGGGPAAGGYGGGQAAVGGAAQPVGGTQAAAGTAAGGTATAGAAAAAGPKADWYPDPQGQARLRYWDGTQWTDQTAD